MKLTAEILRKLEEDFLKSKAYENFSSDNEKIKEILQNAVKDLLGKEIVERQSKERQSKESNPLKSKTNKKSGSDYKGKYIRNKLSETNIKLAKNETPHSGDSALINNKRIFGTIESKVISMYARGMTTWDIQKHLKDIHGHELSLTMISNITGSLLQNITDWRKRQLERIYVMGYFDSIQFKIKEKGAVVNKTIYNCVAIDVQGHRDLLGFWIIGSNQHDYWEYILTDLKNRGVDDILILSAEELRGFSDSVYKIFPKNKIQKSIIHQLRNTLKYITSKDMKEFIKDLRAVYYLPVDEKEAVTALDKLEINWGGKYKTAIKQWRENWNEISNCFNYPDAVRKLIYSTNAIEVLHNEIVKISKSRNIITDDISLTEMIFLAYWNISNKWDKYPIKNWKSILSQLSVLFEDKLRIYS